MRSGQESEANGSSTAAPKPPADSPGEGISPESLASEALPAGHEESPAGGPQDMLDPSDQANDEHKRESRDPAMDANMSSPLDGGKGVIKPDVPSSGLPILKDVTNEAGAQAASKALELKPHRVEDQEEHSLEELGSEEPPVVTRQEQFRMKHEGKGKEPAGEKKAKRKNNCGRGRGRGRGRKTEDTIDLISDDDDDKENKIKKEVIEENLPKSQPKRRAKRKSVAEETTGQDKDDADKIDWKPVSREGLEAWEWHIDSQDRAADGKKSRSSATLSNKEDVGASEDMRQQSPKLKSFARRPCPKSQLARDRWFAVRDTFESTVMPILVAWGFNLSSWEAGTPSSNCIYYMFSIVLKQIYSSQFYQYDESKHVCKLFMVQIQSFVLVDLDQWQVEWWDWCSAALDKTDYKKGSKKRGRDSDTSSMQSLMASEVKLFLQDTALVDPCEPCEPEMM